MYGEKKIFNLLNCNVLEKKQHKKSEIMTKTYVVIKLGSVCVHM